MTLPIDTEQLATHHGREIGGVVGLLQQALIGGQPTLQLQLTGKALNRHVGQGQQPIETDAQESEFALVIRLQPDEGITMDVTIKEPGPGGMRLINVPLDMTFAEALGPWPVSSLAADIGAAALVDRAWQDETRLWLADAVRRLDNILIGAGLDILGGTNLYRLCASKDAMSLYEKLGRTGVYVRCFPDNPEWLRFGLPSSAAHWTRLEKAMLL